MLLGASVHTDTENIVYITKNLYLHSEVIDPELGTENRHIQGISFSRPKKKKKGTNTHSKPRAFGQEWAPYVCQQHPLVASLSTTPSIPRMKPFPRLSRQTLTKSGYRSPRPNAAMRCGALPATHLIFTLIQ